MATTFWVESTSGLVAIVKLKVFESLTAKAFAAPASGFPASPAKIAFVNFGEANRTGIAGPAPGRPPPAGAANLSTTTRLRPKFCVSIPQISVNDLDGRISNPAAPCEAAYVAGSAQSVPRPVFGKSAGVTPAGGGMSERCEICPSLSTATILPFTSMPA